MQKISSFFHPFFHHFFYSSMIGHISADFIYRYQKSENLMFFEWKNHLKPIYKS